ncbi:tetratricopeptide repeat protein [Ascidiaceihabitans sp.]|nr:tetratricopeptide repeat protein [Ascidiaceihabitans sp.]
MRIFLATALISGSAWAEDCPAPRDYSTELDALIASAQVASSAIDAKDLTSGMWDLWLRAPNDQAQKVLDRGLARRDGYDFAGAYSDFDKLVEYCPNYAEGFNQRAYVQFLRGEYAGALVDLDAVLALLPNHVAAQSGRALTLMQMGRLKEARAQMLEALKNNPWLSERTLIAKGAPLGPIGEDI